MSNPTPELRAASRLLKALGDETRLRMLALLGPGELCVCHIAEALGLSQPNASQHLRVLRSAGVVESQRRGGWTYYRLNAEEDPMRTRVVSAVLEGLSPAPDPSPRQSAPCA